VQRYLIAGVLALAPIWVTWVVFNLGARAAAVARVAARGAGDARCALPMGWATTRVIGRRLFQAFENLLERVPLAKAVYRVTWAS
jgi:uncharacterized membrane protein